MSQEPDQTETGNLYGRVTDENGERLPGVTVTLTGPSAERVTVTGEGGDVRFLGLSPGNYTVAARLEGFATVVYEAVNILSGHDTSIEITMSPEVVEITKSPKIEE